MTAVEGQPWGTHLAGSWVSSSFCVLRLEVRGVMVNMVVCVTPNSKHQSGDLLNAPKHL